MPCFRHKLRVSIRGLCHDEWGKSARMHYIMSVNDADIALSYCCSYFIFSPSRDRLNRDIAFIMIKECETLLPFLHLASSSHLIHPVARSERFREVMANVIAVVESGDDDASDSSHSMHYRPACIYTRFLHIFRGADWLLHCLTRRNKDVHNLALKYSLHLLYFDLI